jgi:hypothetical protein
MSSYNNKHVEPFDLIIYKLFIHAKKSCFIRNIPSSCLAVVEASYEKKPVAASFPHSSSDLADASFPIHPPPA